MRAYKTITPLLILALVAFLLPGCRNRSENFVIALSDKISTLDPIGSATVDVASERIRVLIFNSLVKKNEKFDYVPDLATDIKRADDGLSYTFTLHDGVTFHDGKPLTSADVKYTIDAVLASSSGKAASFFEGSGADKKGLVAGVETPDPRTVVIRLTKPWLGLLSNLVAIAIVPKDSSESQKTHPLGSGPFKFISYDSAQQTINLEANPNYWEGAPTIGTLRVRVIEDGNALQAELRSGSVTLAPLPTNLTPDAIKSLEQDQKLQVMPFTGANIVYLGFNVQNAPLDNVKLRQAIAYAIDRETIIRDLILGQGKVAHSILPEESWAYSPGQKYAYDPARAKQLLDEAGFRDPDGDGPQMRFQKPIKFQISSSSVATRQYVDVIRDYLKKVGIPVEVETMETNTLLAQLRLGEFQMTTSRWVGGNQDPIFLKDLFHSSEIPTQERASRNRSRYKNPELDRILDEAVNTADREKAVGLYARAQEIVSRDLPLFPLWYPANMVVANKSVGNIKIDGSGDWSFVRNLTLSK
ncbi:MAG: peptide/nickel transport system substrate-binding protein [Acidobacteriota bacterium]|jgi:peptide/nickel transport system substrate-binding protein|nr:peptide/nickel transport system substrate-binding protein [Acidobacteriota bacterium]